MMKLRFLLIPNPEKVMEMVRHSNGEIYMSGSAHPAYDLKNNTVAQHFFKQEAAKGHGIDLYLTDESDAADFINLMMETA